MRKSLGPKTIAHPAPVFIVGTYDEDGNPNVMAAAWGGICCSKPPCVAVSLRRATLTHGNITARKAFTISIPSDSHVREADHFGMVSGRDENKFSATGLTPVRSDLVDAPYVGEFPLVLECGLRHVFQIDGHTQFVGEILDVKADEAVLNENGKPDVKKVRPIIFAPVSREYYKIGEFIGKAFSIGKKL